jgi:transposase
MEMNVLHRHGWTVSQLAKEFGISRTTVYKELASETPRRYAERAQPTALSEAQARHVERRLTVCPGIRATILHHELRQDYGYEGSYVAFARHLRPLRPAMVKDPEIRFETDPGWQTQADWALCGLWPLGRERAELSALVTILGYSRMPAIRFASDRTRPTTLSRLATCLDDLGGLTREVLTDRDPAFCIGSTSDGRAILAPEWVEMCDLLGVVPKACKPYRAQTKGKVERMVRELKEGFLPWLSGRLLPPEPGLFDYDLMVQQWIHEMVLKRRHRTTGRVVEQAWEEETEHLRPIPGRLLARLSDATTTAATPSLTVVHSELRQQGEQVQVRDLSEYEAAL